MFPAADLCGETAEADMAMGLERAHAKSVGEDEGLSVVAFDCLNIGPIEARCDVAEEAQGIGLKAEFVPLLGKCPCGLGEGLRLLRMASEYLRLAQADTTEGLEVTSSEGRRPFHCLCK